MADELTTGTPSAFHCPWCSAELQAMDLETCPSCKAALTSTGEPALPGVTAIDHEALLRSNREPRPPRNRILSWLSGEYVDEGNIPADAGAIAPPDLEVRREILRLEIEAEIADKQAEVDSILADAAVEGRTIPGLDAEDGGEGTEVGATEASPAGEPAEDMLAAGAETVSPDDTEAKEAAS
jgi:hypothetical protein